MNFLLTVAQLAEQNDEDQYQRDTVRGYHGKIVPCQAIKQPEQKTDVHAYRPEQTYVSRLFGDYDLHCLRQERQCGYESSGKADDKFRFWSHTRVFAWFGTACVTGVFRRCLLAQADHVCYRIADLCVGQFRVAAFRGHQTFFPLVPFDGFADQNVHTLFEPVCP